MKIKNITINNFRSATNLSINLSSNLNVLAGINGSGKTTVLDAIAISLSWLISRIKKTAANGNPIKESDINYNSLFSSLSITCEEENKDFSWTLIKPKSGVHFEGKSELSQLSDLAIYFQEVLELKDKLPIIAYYPVTRVVKNIRPDVKSKEGLHILDVYDNALGVRQSFSSFFDWFKVQDDIINEKFASKPRWMSENYHLIRSKSQEIVKLTSSVLPTDELRYRSTRIFNSQHIYEEPRFLLYELLRLIDLKEDEKFWKIFHILESISHSDLLDSDLFIVDNIFNYYEKVIVEIIEAYSSIKIDSEKERTTSKILWNIFALSNTFILWGLNEYKKRHLEYLLSGLYANLNQKEYNWDSIAVRTIEEFKNVIFDENKRKNTIYNEGKELNIVTEAIEKFIPEYTSLRVKRQPFPHLVINKDGVDFDLNQLSDGEKNLISLVGDIARRLAIANSHSDKPLEGDGIILIDELDLHLHPSWQRIMIPKLEYVFPNCQFIVSTHSPQVLSHVKPECLILLKNEGQELTYQFATESYGKNSDRILEDLLGVDARPTKEKERIKNLYLLIEQGRLEEAKSEIKELSLVIVGGDPELVKANVLIKRREIIGK